MNSAPISVPEIPNTKVSQAVAPKQPSQKSLTKAERRELQERQRAAKAQKKAEAASGPSASSADNMASLVKPKQSQPLSQKKLPADAPAGIKPLPKDVSANLAAIPESTSTVSQTRGLKIFSHFGLPKPVSHVVKGDIHPEIIRLGILFSEFRICGANARCIATLTAFKSVIQDYTTPSHSTLSRHLMMHLSPQISHLVAARPMSVTMGNAIRQLKLEISNSDIDMIEQDAKNALCTKIDNYIRDRIIMADEVIQDLACKKINDGDVILTYARSSVVEKILLRAHEEGKQFSVIVVDSRPLLEGKELLKTLTTDSLPIPCTYALLPALPSLITEATIVLLGAHSISSNGAVYSRAGTALVAMMAKAYSVPVMVCCETYKFSEGVMLDGFGKNELAPSRFADNQNIPSKQNLEILNPLYDLTPPTSITAVVTEVGMIPPTSISSIPLALGKTML